METKLEIIQTENEITFHTKDGMYGDFTLEVDRNNGETEHYDYPMRSFTQRVWEVLISAMTDAWIPNIDLPYRTINSSSAIMEFRDFDIVDGAGGSTNGNYGIQIGSGSTAVAIDDYQLDAYISEASMSRSQMQALYDRDAQEVIFSRNFENISGANVTIREMGLYGSRSDSESESFMMLLTRDVFPDITLADGEILSISIKITWPNMNRNFGAMWDMARIQSGDTSGVYTETDGTTDTVASTTNLNQYFDLEYPDDVLQGVVLGSASGSISTSDFRLNSAIGRGTGTGQLVHGPLTIKPAYNDGTSAYMEFIRSFTNISGADIEVGEIAWYGGSSVANRFMYWAEPLSTPITIPNNATRIFRIIFSVSL